MTKNIRVSQGWIWFSLALVAAALVRIHLVMPFDVWSIAFAAVTLVVLAIGMVRSRTWVSAPHSQLPTLWTIEIILLAGCGIFFFYGDQTMPGLAVLSAAAFQLVFRDYCAGIVQSQIHAEEVSRWAEFRTGVQNEVGATFQLLARPLTDEPAQLTMQVRKAVETWKEQLESSSQQMNSLMVGGAEHFQQGLVKVTEKLQSQWVEGMQVYSTRIQDELGNNIQSCLKLWLDGAQEAGEAWQRASETGTRFLSEQAQLIGKKWEQQMTLSGAWLKEMQALMTQVRSVCLNWEERASDKDSREAKIFDSLESFRTNLEKFMSEFEGLAQQLTHDQKEWTLGLFEDKRYLNIDQ